MTARLRELAERWKSQTKTHNSPRTLRKCADELLAILDAEGDGGTNVPVGRFGAMRLTPKGTREFYGNLAEGAVAPERGANLYIHPARSGGVSDADVARACVAYFDGLPVSGGHIADPEAMRAALEHFAKGERHE